MYIYIYIYMYIHVYIYRIRAGVYATSPLSGARTEKLDTAVCCIHYRCIFIYLCACNIHIYILICIYTCLHMYTHIYMQDPRSGLCDKPSLRHDYYHASYSLMLYICTRIYIYTCKIHMYTCAYIYISTVICIHVCMCVYTYIYMQDPSGGLRDKPSLRRDYYHTCYCLSGLAVTQSLLLSNDPVLGGLSNKVCSLCLSFSLHLAVTQSLLLATNLVLDGLGNKVSSLCLCFSLSLSLSFSLSLSLARFLSLFLSLLPSRVLSLSRCHAVSAVV